MIRILGGSLRGRQIETPKGSDTRPTSALVREAVFGMLQGEMPQAKVLDLFCGSGAYAFEAISRGAQQAMLVDRSAEVVRLCARTAQLLGIGACTEVFCNDYLRALAKLKERQRLFDLVFLDPPYASGYYESALAALGDLVTQDGLVICEHEKNGALAIPPGWQIVKQRHYGSRAITIVGKEQRL